MIQPPSLAAATNGERLVAIALALAVVVFWAGSLGRVLTGRARHPDDGNRSVIVVIAIAVLLFDLRWFWPDIGLLTKDRLALIAHGCMVLTLMLAILIHGHRTGAASVRCTFAVHLAMLVLCIGVSSQLR